MRYCVQEGKKPATADEDDLDDDLDDDLGDDAEDGAPKPLVTTFELADTLYAEAELEDTDSVHLWLGVSSPLPSFTVDANRLP